MAENDSEPTTISSQVDNDLADQIEQLANAEGKSKSEWIREAVEEVASEDSAKLKPEDEIRADVNRVEDKVDQAMQLMVAEMRQQSSSSEQKESSSEQTQATVERIVRVEDSDGGVLPDPANLFR